MQEQSQEKAKRHDVEKIREHLQRQDAQERIQQETEAARSKATVSISQAAKLFGFSETQLRDWEKRGLLRAERPSTQEGKGHRQYAPDELKKLALLKELMNEGKFSPGEIPTNIDEVWKAIDSIGTPPDTSPPIATRALHAFIDQRIEQADETLFHRFYVLHSLRLSLTLISEELPETDIGLVLPFHVRQNQALTLEVDDLATYGESLIAWLSPTKAFYAFIDPALTFEYPSAYHLQYLQAEGETSRQDNTLIVLPRKTKTGSFKLDAVHTIRRLLAPLYEQRDGETSEHWRAYFAQTARDIVYPVTDFNSSTGVTDTILDHLAEMIIHLGGKSQKQPAQDRWRFCCILLPHSTAVPMQQRRLVVRAQSKASPHTVGVTAIAPDKAVIAVSLRAFQSGHTILRSEISAEDASISLREVEGPIHSAIAVPVEGEDGLAAAVIYVVSNEADAFPEADQRLLRMLGRMVEELLLTYRVRRHVGSKLMNIISRPRVADMLFRDYYSENGFIYALESLLRTIQQEMPTKGTERGGRQVSFISVDIDNQTSLASRYGDNVTRNLSRTLGERLNAQLPILFTRRSDWHFYHIYADRYYLILDGTPLEQACDKASRLKDVLSGDYKVDALRTTIEQSTLPDNMLKLNNITVRLGVCSYEYWKLAELLDRYADAAPLASVRSLILRFLDIALYMGTQEGGDRIIAWDHEKWQLALWPPVQQ